MLNIFTRTLAISLLSINFILPSDAVIPLKITNAKLDYLNTDYINNDTYKAGFNDVNYTYSALPLHWGVLQDFPTDTVLVTDILRSETEDGEMEEFDVYISYVCNLNDPNHPYLPNFLYELTEDGNCVQKGEYDFEDSGQVKFNEYLPDSDIDGYYFNTINRILANNGRTLIKQIQIMSKAV